MSDVYDNSSYTLDNYQEDALALANYPGFKDGSLIYPALGLTGESGEVADKIKKWYRNHDTQLGSQLTKEQRLDLVKEIGDVMWYAGALARAAGYTLGEVATINIEKLRDRGNRGVIKGEGDNR